MQLLTSAIQNQIWAFTPYNKLSKKRYLIIVFVGTLLFSSNMVSAQQNIVVKAANLPLNTVLTSLRDNYNLKISFNDDLLSNYPITINQSFNNAKEAIAFLIQNLPLRLTQKNAVFVISKITKNINSVLFAGKVQDALSQETLPYASIVINGNPIVTDQMGNFSYKSNLDTANNFKVSYLGYLKVDTNFYANSNIIINLKQNIININEVVFSDTTLKESDTNFSNGTIKLNKSVGNNLPGSNDNAIYNILRLQPGVLAAGEQSNDLIIWGSYKGQTKVSFDGFTIFGLKNFNDNIGAINPLITKDLTIKKGGYGVTQGDRIGGVVNITGINGNMVKPNITLTANNLTLNGMASTPLFKNTSLVIAGRQTYYNLYNNFTSQTQTDGKGRLKNIVDLKITPDYFFRDFNLKFSGKSNHNDDYYVSLFTAKDNFSSSFSTIKDRFKVNGKITEDNKQFGASAYYSKITHSGGIFNLQANTSGLTVTNNQNTVLSQRNNAQFFNRISDITNNQITETTIQSTYKLPTTNYGNTLMGAGFINNHTSFRKDSANINKIDQEQNKDRLFLFVEQNYFINKKIKFIPGLRTDFDAQLKKLHFQPRLAVSYQISNPFKISASWGIYNQFIAYNGIKDEQGNFTYQWTVSNGEGIPVYKAQHFVLGAQLEQNQFWFNTNLFYKNTSNITRFLQTNLGRITSIGNGRTYGIDFLIKKEIKENSAWVAYTLSKTEEQFPVKGKPNVLGNYNRAPQDQRHEIKFAGTAKIYFFYLSANYVYGSGFPSFNPRDALNSDLLSYNRFDAALTYKFKTKKYALETGLSILNLFNTQNLKTGNLNRIPTEQLGALSIYSQAVPFTPTLFFKLAL